MKKYIIEARESKDGGLKLDCEQPEVKDYTIDDIFRLYWRLSGDKSYSVSQETVNKFFNDKKWFVRAKTW
jgi:hypothetical protein